MNKQTYSLLTMIVDSYELYCCCCCGCCLLLLTRAPVSSVNLSAHMTSLIRKHESCPPFFPFLMNDETNDTDRKEKNA